MDWTLSQIRQRVRILTGEIQFSDTDLNERINDFYHNRFPLEIDDKQLNEWFDLTIYAFDSGDYDVSDDILKIYGNEQDNPVFIDDNEIMLFQDSASFFRTYPRIDTGAAYWITPPQLAIGTSDVKKVKNSAFTFRTNDSDYTYFAAAGETVLSGDTVPQSKYGAWRLEVNGNDTISIVEADDNATGYPTAAQAVAGLPAESADNACMGFVTAINTAGAFIPGTTALDAVGVTGTYTDGYHTIRGIPEAALLEDDILYIRDKPDDTYTFRAYTKIKPAVLASDSSVPLAVEWGIVIALGTALEILTEKGSIEKIPALAQIYDYEKTLINRRYIAQFFSGNQRASANF